MKARAAIIISLVIMLGVIFSVPGESKSTRSTWPMRPVKAAATKYKQKDIRLRDTRLRVIDVGEGQPILFIHGHQSRLEEFEALVPELSKQFRVIAFDLPGSGYSDKPYIDYSLKLYSDYVVEFIEQYVGEPVILAGGSMGGNLTLLVAREHPRLVKKAIAWSPAGTWETHDTMAFFADTLMPGFMYRIILKAQSEYWFSDNFSGKEERVRETFLYIDEVNCPSFRKMAAGLAADQLRNSHLGMGHSNLQPTLIIVGEEDDGLELAYHAKRFAKELPNGQLVVFKDTGHAIGAERPKELLEQIIGFAR